MNNEENKTPKKVKDIMSKNVETVTPDTKIAEVANKMRRRDCGSILVVNDDRVVGMITDRDIALRCIADEHIPAETTAERIMTPDILYCRDSDSADDVAKNMGDNKVRRLAVLDDKKRLVGIVTLGDLASHTNYLLCGEMLGKICREAA